MEIGAYSEHGTDCNPSGTPSRDCKSVLSIDGYGREKRLTTWPVFQINKENKTAYGEKPAFWRNFRKPVPRSSGGLRSAAAIRDRPSRATAFSSPTAYWPRTPRTPPAASARTKSPAKSACSASATPTARSSGNILMIAPMTCSTLRDHERLPWLAMTRSTPWERWVTYSA